VLPKSCETFRTSESGYVKRRPKPCKDPADRKMGPYGMIGLKVNDKASPRGGLAEISRETVGGARASDTP